MTQLETSVGAGVSFALTAEQRELRALAREFAETEIAPSASSWWETAEFPFDLIPKFAALDIVGLGYDWPDRPARSRKTMLVTAGSLVGGIGLVAMILLGRVNSSRFAISCRPIETPSTSPFSIAAAMTDCV